EDEETRLNYLQILIKYIFQAGKNLTKRQAREIANKIPEGREFVMTLAEMYRNEGLEKGLEKGRKEIAKKSISKGMSTEDICDVTELTEVEVLRLQKEEI